MNRIWAWFVWLWQWLWRRTSVDRVVMAEGRGDLPEKLGKSLYIVGDPAKWAVLQCPCGCGERIDVNLMETRNPFWTMSVSGGRVTLYPSLWVPADRCGSHFWLRDNKIIWVDDVVSITR